MNGESTSTLDFRYRPLCRRSAHHAGSAGSFDLNHGIALALQLDELGEHQFETIEHTDDFRMGMRWYRTAQGRLQEIGGLGVVVERPGLILRYPDPDQVARQVVPLPEPVQGVTGEYSCAIWRLYATL